MEGVKIERVSELVVSPHPPDTSCETEQYPYQALASVLALLQPHSPSFPHD